MNPRTVPPQRDWILVPLVLGLLVLASACAANKVLTFDEMENLHAGWHISTGKRIYADFVQGHAPLIYWLLAPITFPGTASVFVIARAAQLCLLACAVALIGFIAEKLQARAGLLAVTLALCTTPIIEYGIEIRPDGLLSVLILSAILSANSDN